MTMHVSFGWRSCSSSCSFMFGTVPFVSVASPFVGSFFSLLQRPWRSMQFQEEMFEAMQEQFQFLVDRIEPRLQKLCEWLCMFVSNESFLEPLFRRRQDRIMTWAHTQCGLTHAACSCKCVNAWRPWYYCSWRHSASQRLWQSYDSRASEMWDAKEDSHMDFEDMLRLNGLIVTAPSSLSPESFRHRHSDTAEEPNVFLVISVISMWLQVGNSKGENTFSKWKLYFPPICRSSMWHCQKGG